MCACCTSRAEDGDEGFLASLFGGGGGGKAKDKAAPKRPATNGNAVRQPVAAAGRGGLFARNGTAPRHDEEESRAAMARHTAMAGREPSLQLYSVSDLPNGARLPANSPGASADRVIQEARHIPPNTAVPVPIETDCFVGHSILLLRKAPGSSPSCYDSYFRGRKRNWEVRVQGRFKRIPEGDMHIGIVLRDFNYNQRVAPHSKIVKSAGMALVKSYDLYLSWGDRCGEALKSNAELSHLVTGMSGWDQIIITPCGQTPPLLSCDLQELGDSQGLNLERAKMGLANYTEAASECFNTINLEDTYTLCFWGVSQVIDLLSWQFKIGGRLSMATFFEESPLHVAMYEINRPEEGRGRNDRHLESDKRYYLDFMFWSNSVKCPSLPARYIFVDAPEEAARSAPSPSVCRQSSNGSQRRGLSPTSSNGSAASRAEGPRSLLALWGERLRWIPQSTCGSAAATRAAQRT